MRAADSSATIDTLVRNNLPLVSYAVAEIAGRIPSHVNRDDLLSAGMYGLVQAATSFDATRGAEFATYAKRRIRGALLDELRSRDWATRSVRDMARQVVAASDELTNALGRTPTSAEVAQRVGVDVNVVAQLSADVDRAIVLNYESIVLGSESEALLPTNTVDPEAQILAREKCAYLDGAVASLPERMRFVVTASFYEDRTLKEIAEELGVAESRVSQIRSDALALLRDGMNAHLEEPTGVVAPSSPRTAKRKAAYFASIAAASDYRTRAGAADADIAERVALSGL